MERTFPRVTVGHTGRPGLSLAIALTCAMGVSQTQAQTQTVTLTPSVDAYARERAANNIYTTSSTLRVKTGGVYEQNRRVYPFADTFVRGGNYSGDNYGGATSLVIKNGSGSSYDRQLFQQYNLGGIAGYVEDADMMQYCRKGGGSGSNNPGIRLRQLYSGGEGWDEYGLTWDNRYTSGNNLLGKIFSNTSWDWINWSSSDLTTRTRSQQGGTIGFIQYQYTTPGSRWVDCTSREHSNRPYLSLDVDWNRNSSGAYVTPPLGMQDDHQGYIKFPLASVQPYKIRNVKLTFEAYNSWSSVPDGVLGVEAIGNDWTATKSSWWWMNSQGLGASKRRLDTVAVSGTSRMRYTIDNNALDNHVRSQIRGSGNGDLSIAFHEETANSKQFVNVFSSESGYTPKLEIEFELCPYTVDYGGADLRYCANQEFTDPAGGITRAIIAVHGSGQDADQYYDKIWKDAGAARQPGLLVVAPRFLDGADYVPPKTHYWEGTKRASWIDGGSSARGSGPYSFDMVDHIVNELVRVHGSTLKNIVVVGHSAGGQFVSRYAASTEVVDGLPDGITMSFGVSAPGSFMWPTSLRPLAVGPGCTNSYDNYRYGTQARYGYAEGPDPASLLLNMWDRNIYYVVGEKDNDPNDSSLPKSCSAATQGAQRVDRMRNFVGTHYFLCAAVRGWEACGHIADSLQIAPGCPHLSSCNFDSPWGDQILFGLP